MRRRLLLSAPKAAPLLLACTARLPSAALPVHLRAALISPQTFCPSIVAAAPYVPSRGCCRFLLAPEVPAQEPGTPLRTKNLFKHVQVTPGCCTGRFVAALLAGTPVLSGHHLAAGDARLSVGRPHRDWGCLVQRAEAEAPRGLHVSLAPDHWIEHCHPGQPRAIC